MDRARLRPLLDMEGPQAEMTRLQLLARMAHRDEMVGPALLLPSDAGSSITGRVAFADGGRVPR